MAGDTYPTVKVAAVQAASVFLDREATVDKACRLIEEAGGEGAQIIVFPECFIAGFPYWYYFYIAHDPKIDGFNVAMFKNSVEVPGPDVTRLGQAARRAGAYVVMGMNERPPNSYGTLYNTMLFLGPDGEIAGKRRKLVPTRTERLVHTGGDGSGLIVIDTPFGGLSGLMCGENTNYLAKFTLIARGEVIHAACWPAFCLDTQVHQKDWIDIRTRSHAFEGKVWVISSAGVFSEQIKDVLELDAAARARFRGDGGHSAVLNPNGQFVAGPLEQGEGIVYADIDLNAVVAGRIFQDITGHYNRFDIFNLTVDQSERPPVTMKRGTAEPEPRSDTEQEKDPGLVLRKPDNPPGKGLT